MNLDNLYFHFTSDKLRDGSSIPPIGKWLIFPKKPIICRQGLHASKHPYDALAYAPGNLLHIVELLKIETRQEDKVVAKGRKIVATIDSTKLLQRYSRKCASDVLHLWEAPEIAKEFLTTGEDPVAARAASDAARAASDAARAASDAARQAAWAASDAAWAARQAAWAASDAARAAGYAARAASYAPSYAGYADAIQKQRDYLFTETMKEFKRNRDFIAWEQHS